MNKFPFFIIPFMDEKERQQVVAVWATTAQEAIEKVTAYQKDRDGLRHHLQIKDVREIEGPDDEGLQILWHQDFD